MWGSSAQMRTPTHTHTYHITQHTRIVSNGPHKLAATTAVAQQSLVDATGYRVKELEGRCDTHHMIRQQHQQQAEQKNKQLKCGVPSRQNTDPHAPTRTHTYDSTHRTDTNMQCLHTHSSGPHKLYVPLLLYRGCLKVETFYSTAEFGF